MALEKVFRRLAFQLRRFSDRLRELEITVVTDKPPARDAAIVDNFECAVDDLRGWVQEALAQSAQAEKAVDHPIDLEVARRALSACQERLHRIDQIFASNFLSYDRVKDLTTFGTERRGEWPSWVTTVKQGIEQCRDPLESSNKAVAECWEEIAARIGTTSISVRTTAIGQNISRAATDDGELAAAEST
jgi:hypothetical protein